MKFTVIKKCNAFILLLIHILGSAVGIGLSILILSPIEVDQMGIIVSYILLILSILPLVKILWDIFYGVYSYTIKIDKNGIEYKKRKEIYFLRWEDVDDIMIYPNTYGIINKSSMICFIKRKNAPLLLKNIKQFNNNFFGAQFREKLVYEIKKYWNKPIQGIYQVIDKKGINYED